MALDLTRRGLITGLVSFAVTAPAIVRAANLMPIKVIEPEIAWPPYAFNYGKSRMFALMHRGLYEIWWEPGEDAPRIRNITPEPVDAVPIGT